MLKTAIEQAIETAYLAGAQWHAIWVAREDSAAVGRQLRKWQDDHHYQQALRRQQQEAAGAIARAILQLLPDENQQLTLF